jgi:glycosyltransferase involved in cell wall biosynthesis
VHTYHGHVFHSYFSPARTRLFLAVDRILARINTDRIVVLGQQQLEEIRDRFRVGRPSQFAIVPLGIDLARVAVGEDIRKGVRAALGIDGLNPLVGIVARLVAVKNHDLFLRVAARMGTLARFVVFGDGPERHRLQRRAAELGLGTGLVFAGTRTLEEIYGSLDVMALTSWNEGTPLALIEAMASGIPVISTAVGGVVDLLGPVEERIVADGAGFDIRARGISVAPDDDVSFAAGLARLLGDEPLRQRLIASAGAYVQNTHTEGHLIAGIIRLYRAVAAPSKVPTA